MVNYIITSDGLLNVDYLKHHGVKGMKWGVRRNKSSDISNDAKTTKKMSADQKRKIVIGVGVGAVGAVLAGYGAYKLSKYAKSNNISISAIQDKGKAAVDKLISDKNMVSKLNRPVEDISPKTLQRGKEATSRLNLDIQLFSHKKEFKGRAHQMPKPVSIAMTTATHEERNSPTFTRNIDGYRYLFINRPGDYPLYKKLHKITKTIHGK